MSDAGVARVVIGTEDGRCLRSDRSGERVEGLPFTLEHGPRIYLALPDGSEWLGDGEQLFRWRHGRGVETRDRMSNVPRDLRAALERDAPLRYYTRERLFSTAARAMFVAPDIAELP